MITSLYTALLGIIFLFLSVQVIISRTKHKISLGLDDKVSDLTKKVRIHGNFAEYIPFALFMMFLCENAGMSSWLLHICGTALIIGRISHMYGMDKVKEIIALRVFGMLCTFGVFGVLIVSLLYLSI